jgi:hypothetical protein
MLLADFVPHLHIAHHDKMSRLFIAGRWRHHAGSKDFFYDGIIIFFLRVPPDASSGADCIKNFHTSPECNAKKDLATEGKRQKDKG